MDMGPREREKLMRERIRLMDADDFEQLTFLGDDPTSMAHVTFAAEGDPTMLFRLVEDGSVGSPQSSDTS